MRHAKLYRFPDRDRLAEMAEMMDAKEPLPNTSYDWVIGLTLFVLVGFSLWAFLSLWPLFNYWKQYLLDALRMAY